MVSKCPSCKRDIEHEDFLFEVQCTCGVRFNPFMPAEVESSPMGDGSLVPELQAEAAVPDFSESNAVFQELRDFGETMGTGQAPPPSAPSLTPSAAPTPLKTSAPAAPRTFAPSDANPVMTSGDALPGYEVDAYYAPISSWSAVNSSSPNPLKDLFDSLWQQAQACGANGVLAIRWAWSMDGQKVLATGTPVRCGRAA